MTSKEALKELEDTFENDVYKVEREMLNIIKKDLEVLEILKKYVRYDDENHVIRMKPFRKSEFNFDYEEVKEWIEK